MGVFRDFKDMVDTVRSDDLKELKRTAGAMPKTSMLDGVKLANQAVGEAQVWQAQAGSNPMAGMGLGADPMGAMAAYNAAQPGSATVQAIADSGTQINGAPVMDLDLLVTIPGQAPYPVRHRQLVALSKIPSFQPGATFPVRADQSDPSKIVIG
jgi:hypothetical protein